MLGTQVGQKLCKLSVHTTHLTRPAKSLPDEKQLKYLADKKRKLHNHNDTFDTLVYTTIAYISQLLEIPFL